MNKILPLIVVFVLSLSCQKKSAFEVAYSSFSEKSTMPCEAKSCTEVQVKVPLFKGKNPALDSINNQVRSLVADIIAFDQIGTPFDSYEAILKSFVHSYDDIKRKFPNEPIPWEAKIDSEYYIYNDRIVSVVLDFYTFTGGAHGNPGIISVFYDLRTGAEIPQQELFVNYNGYKELVQKAFYTEKNLPENASLNEHGFMFEDNEFYLPQNIIISPKNVRAHYNHYEIASYADGPTDVVFTFDEVRPFLNDLYFK